MDPSNVNTRPVRATPAGRDPAVPSAVLVVEDEQIVALELKDRVTRMGHTVVGIASSGEDAIETAKRTRPDLVLMDIKLEGAIDGIDAAAAIQQVVDAAIVYLTAFADRETLERAKVTQPYGYILKPFQERELQVVIEVSLYRRAVERALRESELWRQALLRSVGDAVVAADSTGRVRFMNPLAEALTGWSEADALDRPFADVFRTNQIHERRSGTWKDAPFTNLIAKDGTERPIELHRTPITDGASHMGTVCVFRDASDSRRRRDRQRFLAYATSEMASSLEGDVVLTRVATLIAQSRADWCAIHIDRGHGTLVLEAIAHRDASMHDVLDSLGGADVQDRGETLVGHVVQTEAPLLERGITGRDWPARALGIDPLRAERLAAASAIIVPLVTGERCLGTLTIVSERREHAYDAQDLELAEELARRIALSFDNAQLYADAKRATAMRDEVLALVTHDLRNPLTAITLRAEQLQAPSPDLPAHAASILRSARRMARMIDELLDVARVDSGRLSVAIERVSTTALVSEALSTFETVAAQRSIRLDGASVPAAELACDHGRVLQVLANLIGNALKFSPDGASIRVQGTLRPDCFELSVIDEGMGIAPSQLARVFERHWQAPETRHLGSGLGLYISKGIVEAHGGRIWVESRPGRGSTFHFTIPLAPGSQAELAPHP